MTKMRPCQGEGNSYRNTSDQPSNINLDLRTGIFDKIVNQGNQKKNIQFPFSQIHTLEAVAPASTHESWDSGQPRQVVPSRSEGQATMGQASSLAVHLRHVVISGTDPVGVCGPATEDTHR